MNILKSFSMKWWQTGAFKLAMISLGLAIGLTWPELFLSLRLLFWALFVVLGGYIFWIWWKQ